VLGVAYRRDEVRGEVDPRLNSLEVISSLGGRIKSKGITHHNHTFLQGQSQAKESIKAGMTLCILRDGVVRIGLTGTWDVVNIHS